MKPRKTDGSGSSSEVVQQEVDAGTDNSEVPDWRLEMRQEIRAAVAESLGERSMSLQLGPSSINESDVVDSSQIAEMMRKIESSNSDNKTAIRLANITKEGNKQHFIDMIEIRQEIQKAMFSIKDSIVRLYTL